MGELPDYFVGVSVFIVGLLVGSFLNVVIYRLPKRKSIVFPGSSCPACDAAIKPYDNIPVLSYAALGGKCRNCRARISPIYPAVELLVALVYLLVFLKVAGMTGAFSASPSGPTRQFWLTLVADLVFVSLIIPLVFIDLRHKILPDAINYPGLVILFALRLVEPLAPDPWVLSHTPKLFDISSDLGLALVGSALGALAGGGSLWLVREAYYRLKHVEGMGLGDIKMMLMVGAFLGWQLTLLTIFIASLLGSVVGVLLISMRGGNMKMEIPFGVFLGPAAIVAMFAGPLVIDSYLRMFAR